MKVPGTIYVTTEWYNGVWDVIRQISPSNPWVLGLGDSIYRCFYCNAYHHKEVIERANNITSESLHDNCPWVKIRRLEQS